MGIKHSSHILPVLIAIVLLLSLSPSYSQSYNWPVVESPENQEPLQSTITSTLAEPRDNGTSRDHFHWGIDIDDNYLVDKTGQHPIHARAIEAGELLAVSDDAECIKHSRFRYCHVEFRHGFRVGKEVEPGDVFAKLEDEGRDNDPDGDHLHFEEAVEEFSEEGQEFDINRRDPLRSFRDESGGLQSPLTDSVAPTINEITFFENDPDPTDNEEPDPFPRLSVTNPDGPPNQIDEPGDDTWVVWGPVDVGAKIRDPGISPVGSSSALNLGIHGYTLSLTENIPLLNGDQNFTSEFSHQYDTIPGVHDGLNREEITKSAFLPSDADDEGHHYNLLAKPGRELKDEADLSFEGVFRSSPGSLFHLDRGMDRAWLSGIGGQLTYERMKQLFIQVNSLAAFRILEGPYRSQVTSTDVNANKSSSEASPVVVDGMRPFSYALIIETEGFGGAGYFLIGDNVRDDGLKFLRNSPIESPNLHVSRESPDEPINVLFSVPSYILPSTLENSLTFAHSNPNLRTNLTMDGTHLIEDGEIKSELDLESITELELWEMTTPWPPEDETHTNNELFSQPDIFVKSLSDQDGDLMGLLVEGADQNLPRRFELSARDQANTLTDGTPSTLGVRNEDGTYSKNDNFDTFDSTLELTVDVDANRPGATADYYNYSHTDKSTVKLNLKDDGSKEFWGDTQPGRVLVVADGDTVINKNVTLFTDEDKYNSNLSVEARDHVFVALLDGANLINTYYWENVSGTWKRQTRTDESIIDTVTREIPNTMQPLMTQQSNTNSSNTSPDVLKTKPGKYIERIEYGFTYQTSKGDKMYCVLSGDGELKLSDVEWK